MTRRPPRSPRPSARRSAASRAAKGHRAGALRRRARREGVAYAGSCRRPIARGRVTRGRRRARRSPCPACSRCSRTRTRRGSRRGRRRRADCSSSRREVAYRGQVVAAVVAETLEAAREARRGSCASTTTPSRTTSCCAADHPALYTPEKVNPRFPTDVDAGRPRRRARRAPTSSVDATYTTPAEHNNPMEPHATLAALGRRPTSTLYDSNQGRAGARATSPRCSASSPSGCASWLRARRRRLRLKGTPRAPTWSSPRWPRASSAARSSSR